jgi:hypothetical protein
MKEHKTRNLGLALVGLLALSIYILACTSFSPDDTKILYPAFDPPSRAIGMAVYDRETKRSEMLYLPLTYQVESNNITSVPAILRADWLPSGREIVVSYCSEDKSGGDDAGMNVALIPWGVRKPIKLFRLPEAKEAGQTLFVPLCIVSDRVFLQMSDRGIGRLDLRTGAFTVHEFKEDVSNVLLYPALDDKSVLYLESEKWPGRKSVFGRLNPNDFRRTPLMVITNEVSVPLVLASDKGGRMLAFINQKNGTNDLVVLRDGRQIFARSLSAPGERRYFGNAILNPNGKALWATFLQSKSTNTMDCGLMEIPFSDAPPRELTLISNAPLEDSDSAMYFQAGISHDGKTAAIASTYLACMGKGFKASDCALFLVDLSKPQWPVTKVPIPMPPERPHFSH